MSTNDQLILERYRALTRFLLRLLNNGATISANGLAKFDETTGVAESLNFENVKSSDIQDLINQAVLTVEIPE